MKLNFKFKSQVNFKQLEIIEELSYYTTKLYNIISYDLRENVFNNLEIRFQNSTFKLSLSKKNLKKLFHNIGDRSRFNRTKRNLYTVIYEI